ncbi:MAG TPA: GNAT family N-acetyltransferase [Gammaproteobacteria bacterium]|nr:GNAT family N-acetyltransferase [Gammaproteobacteria bacterium]
MRVRLAKPSDAAAINDIYAPHVSEGAASFELSPPNEMEMAERIRRTVRERPWLVYEDRSDIWGYAYSGKHRERPGYQWSVEVSVYVHYSKHRTGVARALYAELLQELTRLGYYNAYAIITLPNIASVGLHESFGFVPVGVCRNAGFKLGRWWDVGWWQKSLRAYTVPIGAPVSLEV